MKKIIYVFNAAAWVALKECHDLAQQLDDELRLIMHLTKSEGI